MRRHGDLEVLEWPALVGLGVEVVVTTRSGGVSAAPYDSLNLGLHVGDDPAAVLENRRRAAAALGATLDDLVVGAQVHGCAAAVVTRAEAGSGATAAADALAGIDALVTAEQAVVLVTLVADCVPLVLFDPVARVLATVHAGWRGTVARVPEAALAAMAGLGSRPADVVAALGPAVARRALRGGRRGGPGRPGGTRGRRSPGRRCGPAPGAGGTSTFGRPTGRSSSTPGYRASGSWWPRCPPAHPGPSSATASSAPAGASPSWPGSGPDGTGRPARRGRGHGRAPVAWGPPEPPERGPDDPRPGARRPVLLRRLRDRPRARPADLSVLGRPAALHRARDLRARGGLGRPGDPGGGPAGLSAPRRLVLQDLGPARRRPGRHGDHRRRAGLPAHLLHRGPGRVRLPQRPRPDRPGGRGARRRARPRWSSTTRPPPDP